LIFLKFISREYYYMELKPEQQQKERRAIKKRGQDKK
jgi:hypothetical protein